MAESGHRKTTVKTALSLLSKGIVTGRWNGRFAVANDQRQARLRETPAGKQKVTRFRYFARHSALKISIAA